MAIKYVDSAGLATFWEKVKARDTATLDAAKNYVSGTITDVNLLKTYFTNGMALQAYADEYGRQISSHYVLTDTIGKANGIVPLDANRKISNEYLPSYVDDIVEGYLSPVDNTVFATDTAWLNRIPGEAGKIYVDISNNKTYRWSGTRFTLISESIALGEVTGTAYDGGKGAANRTDINKLLGYFNTSGYALRAISDAAGNDIQETYTTKSYVTAALQNSIGSQLSGYATKIEAVGSFSVSGTTVTYKDINGKTLGTFDTQDTVYTLPRATDDVLGGVKTGYTDNNKAYGVKLDTNGRMYVYVPWEEATYEEATSSVLGLVKMDKTGQCLDAEEGVGIVPDGASVATYVANQFAANLATLTTAEIEAICAK